MILFFIFLNLDSSKINKVNGIILKYVGFLKPRYDFDEVWLSPLYHQLSSIFRYLVRSPNNLCNK